MPSTDLSKLIVFDLDGTLVDSRSDLAQSANQLLAESGCAPLSEDLIGRMVGDGAATLVARAFAASGCRQPDDALAQFLNIYNGRLLASTRAYPEVPEVLTALRPRAVLAVLTNKPVGPTRQILDGLALASYFDADFVVGGDGPFPRKPDPASLLDLAARARVTIEQTLLVGDSLIDWRTAHAAGARVCLARYGFGFRGFPVDRLTDADRVIDRPLELLNII